MMNPTPQTADEAARLADIWAPVIDPDGYDQGGTVRCHADTKLVSLERFRTVPARMVRVVEFRDAPEFVDYCNRFTKADQSAGFATIRPLCVRYVIDYGTEAAPLWGMHKADYVPDYSPQFKAWHAAQKKQMTHAAFAEFIEERLPDIVNPDAATMLEMATSFQASGTTQFSSAVRLTNGDVQFNFAREVRGNTKQGQCEIPAMFVIRIPMYEFHGAVDLTARLRYRITDNHLAIWFEFANMEDTLAGYDMEQLNAIRANVKRISLGKVVKSLTPVVMTDDE